jgi:hypothetical protein
MKSTSIGVLMALVCASCIVVRDPCSPGYTSCGDYCADLAYDARDCGACGASCRLGDYCSQGVCVVGSCIPDGAGCAYDSDCCSRFCASDGVCGCIGRGNYGCALNVDCCSNYCGYDGYCR